MMKILFYISILMSLGYAQFKMGGLLPFGVGMGISGENKNSFYLSTGIDIFLTPFVLLVSLFPGSGK